MAIAIYGGYFGGGIGVMMLAALSITGMRDIHEINGLKSLLTARIDRRHIRLFVIVIGRAMTAYFFVR